MSAPELRKSENGVWYVCWTDGRRSKRVSTRTRDLDAAKAFFGTWLLMEKEAAAPTYTCSDLWLVYIENVRRKGTSLRHDFIWRRLEPAFGGLRPSEVTQARVDAYAADRIRQRVKLSTVWLELTKLKASWNLAVKRRLLPSTELPDFELPERPQARDRWLREEELARLLDMAAAERVDERLTRLERFLWLAVETGARKNAIIHLDWSQVDFDIGVIHYLKPGVRQTSKRKVSVPISKALLPVLRRAYSERTGRWVLDHPTDLYHGLANLGTRAGVGGVTPHVLRHTAATWMARRGVSLWKIAGVLGNSVRMVEQVYAKHSPDGLADAVDAINGGRLRAVGE